MIPIQVSGGDEENRTPDPLLARQVLSQLSYTPKFYPTLRQFQLDIHYVLSSLHFLDLNKITLSKSSSCLNLLSHFRVLPDR